MMYVEVLFIVLSRLLLGAVAGGPASFAGVSNAAAQGRGEGRREGGHSEKGSFLEPGATPVSIFQSFITFAI